MSYTSSPNGLFSYTISGTSDATEISVIQSAFDKWDSLVSVPDRFLDEGETKYTITITYSVADLADGILGSAALQTYRWNTSNTFGNMMPLTGYIQLNTDYTATMLADVRTSGKTRYYYVVLHEIGHILGIGPFWSTSYSAPLGTYTENSTTKYYYTGTNAVEQYKSYLTNPEKNLILGIPIEDEGGTGTQNVHPEEGLETGVSTDDRYIDNVFHPGLNTELMTGWMEGSPDDTPLSRITLGFLADQGYNVNYSDAESFSIIYTNMSYNFDDLRDSGQTDEQIQAAYPNAFLDASLGYFNNANKFKESYVKDLLDVSGNIKVYPGYKTLVESSIQDISHNIAGTLHTNTLNIVTNNDLSLNTLSVNQDVSFNKQVTIEGDLIVKGAMKFPDNVLETTDFSDYDSNSLGIGENEFNFNNSNIYSGLDLSGIDVYVAGETTVNANDFKIEGNVYANSIINDEKDNPIMEDDTLINRLDLSNNPFKVKKTYAAANYAAIPENQYSISVTPNYNWDFRVASSTSINDSIQNVTATYVGTTSTVENGLEYTGYNKHATLPTGMNNGPGSYSVELYFKNTTAWTSWDTILTLRPNNVCTINFSQYSSDGTLSWTGGDVGNSGTAAHALTNISATTTLNQWTHALVTYENTSGDATCTARYYLNGSLVNTYTGTRKVDDTTTTDSDDPGYIGAIDLALHGTNYDSTGYIRYVRLYNKMLSDTEVSALYSRRDNTELTSSSVPYISDTGKNMAFMNFNTNGTYNTAFSNNYGTSFVDMATRLGGTTTGSHGVLNLHVTDNQKYIYGINPTRGIVKSSNYGYEFTDVSMVSLPDSDLSFSILNSQVFDLSHADTICSSSDGKHTYIAGPHTDIPAPSYDYDFKNSQSGVDNITSYSGTFHGDAHVDNTGLVLDGAGDHFEMNSTNFTWGGTNTMEIYVKLTAQTQSGQNLGIMGFGQDDANTGGAYFIMQTGTAQTYYGYRQLTDSDSTVSADTTTSINYNNFDHHVFVFDPTSGIKYYINGTLVNDSGAAYTSTAQTRSNYEYRVGSRPYDDANYGIKGIFSHVRIWNNVAFTSNQVSTLYNNRDNNTNMWYKTDISPSYFLIKSSDYGNNFVFDVSANQIGVMKQENESLNATSVHHLSCSSDGKYVVANIKGVTKANYLMNDLTGTSHPVLSTDYGNNWEILNSHHFKEYQVLENLDLSFNQVNLNMNCVGVKISKTGRYIACALGSQELSDKMLFYLSSDYGKTFDFKSILNFSSGASSCQINLSPNSQHIVTCLTDQVEKVNISTDYGVNWKEVDLTLNGLSANDSAKSYVSGNLQYLANNQKSSGLHNTNNTFITPYVKTCYTHMVKDNANILNGNTSAASTITYSGGVLTASDYRLKSNIQTLSGETLDNLRPVKFNFSHNNQETFGLIAHELQEEYPYLVDGEKDGANYQTVNYTGLLALCAHELQQIKKGLEEYD